MLKKSLLLMLLMTLLAPWAAVAQSELTVYEGEDGNSNVPFYGLYADTQGAAAECVIPADQLAEMAGGTISAMKFYIKSSAAAAWTATFNVYLKEIDATTLTGITGPTTSTVVCTGNFDATGNELTVTFDTPYAYEGGNLLIGTYVQAAGNWKSATFYGVNQEGNTGWYRNNGSASGSGVKFLPKTTFTYEAAAGGCDMPTAIAVDNITTNGATVTWEGDGTEWNLRYKKASDTDFTLVNGLTTKTYSLTSLDENTAYNVGVQTVCTGAASSFKSTSFTTANPCAAPKDLQFSNITATSADLSWTAGYQETTWTVKYKKSTESEYKEATASGSPALTLTELSGLTKYNVQVYNCEETYVEGSFTTAAVFPYSQDFSGSGIPAGWTQYSGLLANIMAGTAQLSPTTYGWSNGTSNSVLDGNHITANIYSTGCTKWIVTPAIPMESDARLTFDVAYTAYSGTAADPGTDGTDDKFVVLASTDNMTTWTILRQWDNAGSEYVLNNLNPSTLSLVFDMAAYAGQYLNIAFYAESTVANTDNNIHVDNVVFELIPACEKPTSLAVAYNGGTEATVTWEGSAEAYNIDVNGTVTNNVTSPYPLTGLELGTEYEVKVQANCGASGTSEWTNAVSFTTDLCMPSDMCTINYSLTDQYNDSWNGAYINVVDVVSSDQIASITMPYVTGPYTGSFSVCKDREIRFDWVKGSYPGECGFVLTDINDEVILSCAIGSAPTTSGTLLESYTVDCTVTSCKKPSNLAASEIGGHSAKLSWTENGEATEWVVAYKISSEEKFTEVNTSDNPYTLTGLAPETEYTVKVNPVCEVDKWSDEITFTTDVACSAPTATVETTSNSATVTINGEAELYNLRYRIPRGFNYGFEQAEAWVVDDFAPCTTYDGDGTRTYGFENIDFPNENYVGACIAWQSGTMDQADAHSGNACGMMVNAIKNEYPSGITHTDDWFILPELTIQTGDVFSFWAREIFTNYGPELINVGIYGTTEGTFAELFNEETISISTMTWTQYSFDLSDYVGQTIKLAINCVSDDVWAFMFDDIFVGNPADETWDYTYNNIASPYEITGLEPATEYQLEVQAICEDEITSAWFGLTFMTMPLCEAPTNVAVTDITTENAVVSWISDGDSFDVMLGEELFEGVTSPYTLEHLDAGTSYTVKVRTNCGTDGYSAWTTAYTFRTPCFAFDIPYEYGFDDVATSDNPEITCWTYGSFNTSNSMTFVYRDQEAGDVALRFASYNEADDYRQILVTPELNSTTDIAVAFEYYVTSSYTAGESIMIGYSETMDLDEFTWLPEETFDYTGEWEQHKAVIVPAGTKYVAVLYTSIYQYYLYVDNFSFTEATGVTQTLEFTEGWNWFSTNIEMDPIDMILAFEEALDENGIMIKNMDYVTEYDGEEWFGDLDDEGIASESMYKVQVSADCTVVIEGDDYTYPEDHAITLLPGWNWIGFPCNEEVEIEVAFENFEATEGDILKNSEAATDYDGEEWFGDIEYLTPGEGYMYFNNSEDEQVLIFSVGSKGRKASNPEFGKLTKGSKVFFGECKSINGDNNNTNKK